MECPICHRKKTLSNRRSGLRRPFDIHRLRMHIMMSHGKSFLRKFDADFKKKRTTIKKSHLKALKILAGMQVGMLIGLVIMFMMPLGTLTALVYSVFSLKLTSSYDYTLEMQNLVADITHSCSTDNICSAISIEEYVCNHLSYSTTAVFNQPLDALEVGYADCDTGSYIIGNMLAIKGITHQYKSRTDLSHVWLEVYIDGKAYTLDWIRNYFGEVSEDL